ncbi:MAG: orotidine-5'-phosphate decarboxylase [Dehalococcoidia bacterium]|jgi:orotidine-5'-phosphate decarboxylase|nr:orotidine-5'-phosphate decarboxylase [Dehalococcoidia bacterium]
MGFFAQLDAAIKKNNSLLCVGLDPNPSLMPPGVDALTFNKTIIDATADIVCAYKPNLAFYEAAGQQGWDVLKQTINYIPKGIPVIADAKRGDIGNTSQAYAAAIFENLGAGAVTVSPYLGLDSVEPFLKNYPDKGVFILCRTSNQGATDFQSLPVKIDNLEMPLYQAVARKAEQWNTLNNVGLVVGATYPAEMQELRKTHPDLPFLVPGIGAQGGDIKLTLETGLNTEGKGIIVNSSRQILYASRGSDFAKNAALAAETLRQEINLYRQPCNKEN